MNNKIKEGHQLFENDEFDGEISDKETLPELLNCSALPLLYTTEGLQEDVNLYR